MKNKEENSLGQIFTNAPVANYMVSLLNLNKTSYILDPCAGDGAFLNALKLAGYNNCVGYEIDGELINLAKIHNKVIKTNSYLYTIDGKMAKFKRNSYVRNLMSL